MRWLARVYVVPKAEVLDPQGEAIHGALRHLGFSRIESVRSGRYFELHLTAEHRAAAQAVAHDACTRLLANTVVESFQVAIDEARAEAPV